MEVHTCNCFRGDRNRVDSNQMFLSTPTGQTDEFSSNTTVFINQTLIYKTSYKAAAT